MVESRIKAHTQCSALTKPNNLDVMLNSARYVLENNCLNSKKWTGIKKEKSENTVKEREIESGKEPKNTKK